MEACIHAAQNELLPLRVVVQVLFFEHVRIAMAGGKVADLPHNIKTLFVSSPSEDSSRPPATLSSSAIVPPSEEDRWSIAGLESLKPKLSTPKMKLSKDEKYDDVLEHNTFTEASPHKVFRSHPSRPKRMISKLLSLNRSASKKRADEKASSLLLLKDGGGKS
ncbi:hypothetical protein Dimus_032018 [Dionaea muscipula]